MLEAFDYEANHKNTLFHGARANLMAVKSISLDLAKMSTQWVDMEGFSCSPGIFDYFTKAVLDDFCKEMVRFQTRDKEILVYIDASRQARKGSIFSVMLKNNWTY